MKGSNGLRNMMIALSVALALLAGTARAATWWLIDANGGGDTKWENLTSWTAVPTATSPNPTSVPGPTDTVVYCADGATVNCQAEIDADRSISGLVFRTGSPLTYLYFKANYNGSTARRLTIGASGLTFIPGTCPVRDYGNGNGLVTIALGVSQNWIGKAGNGLTLQGSVVDGGGNNLSLVRIAMFLGTPNQQVAYAPYATVTNMPSLTLAEGASVTLYNSGRYGSAPPPTDRIADAVDIVSYGGSLSFPKDTQYSYYTNYTETVHTLQLVKGTFSHVQASAANAAFTNIFIYAGGLNRTGPTATLVFSGSYLGSASYANRVLFAGQASATLLGGWGVFPGSGFAAYDATVDSTGYARGVYGTQGSSLTGTTSDGNGIYNINALLTTATTDLKVLALVHLRLASAVLALGGHTLTISSGGLIFDCSNGSGGPFYASISNGTVTAGTGIDTNLFVFVPAPPSNPVVATNNTKVVDAVIADNVAQGNKVGLVKDGPYVLTLKQANTYTGNTTINDGTLYLATAGSIAKSPVIELLYGCLANQYYSGWGAAGARLDVSDQTSTWTLGANQTLKGNGVVIGNVNVNGTVAPGTPSTGMLTVTGNVTFANNSTFKVSVTNSYNASERWGYADTWNAGYSRLKVYGNVNLGANAILDVESVGTPSMNNGDKLFIIDNSGVNPVSGQFKTLSGRVLNDGDVFTAAGTNFQIRYTGNLPSFATNGGNSVVIQVTSQAATGIGKGTAIMFK